jgi:hypothetical protein
VSAHVLIVLGLIRVDFALTRSTYS